MDIVDRRDLRRIHTYNVLTLSSSLSAGQDSFLLRFLLLVCFL